MTGKRSERAYETPQETWERRLDELGKAKRPVVDTYEETVEWYTAYLCGVLDTLTEFKAALYAADAKEIIKETIESILKDGMVLQAKG